MSRPLKKPKHLDVTPFSEIKALPVDWLVPGWIVRGELNLLLGEPGLGKSVVSIDIAAAVTQGRPIPVLSSIPVEPGGVLVMSSEDSPAHVILPRLMAAGGRPGMVHLMNGVQSEDTEVMGAFAYKEGSEPLRDYLSSHPEIRLLVIDPLSGFFGGGVDTHKDASVRDALQGMLHVAREFGVAILAIVHPNKRTDLRAIYRCSGSLAMPALARTVMALVRHPEDSSQLVLVPVKSNMGQLADCVELEVRGREVELEDGTVVEAAAVSWSEGPCSLDRDTLLGGEVEAARPGPQPTERGRAATFLQGVLAEGPMAQASVRELAREQGIADGTLTRAKEELGVRSEKERGVPHGRFLWSLPEAGTEEAEEGHGTC